jgi:hypothetical protein
MVGVLSSVVSVGSGKVEGNSPWLHKIGTGEDLVSPYVSV